MKTTLKLSYYSVFFVCLLISCGGNNVSSSSNSKEEATSKPHATANQEVSSVNNTSKDNLQDTTVKIKTAVERDLPATDKLTDSKIKNPSHFSINYKLEIIKVRKECQECGRKENDTYLKFPDINLSKYGKEEDIKKLWEKHKEEVEEEIYGGGGGLFGGKNRRFLTNLGSIVGGSCKVSRSKRHDWYSDEESTFENRTFKH